MLTDNDTQKERDLTFPCLKLDFDRFPPRVQSKLHVRPLLVSDHLR